MYLYTSHKVISLLLIIGLSLVSFALYPTGAESRWYVLLLAMTIFGYSHYLVGGYYQLRSFHRKATPARWFKTFSILVVFSLMVCGGFYWWGSSGLLAFAVIGYFMVHGLFNEITLFERQTGQPANRFTIYALAAGLLGVALYAVGHASWYFTPQLDFIAVSGLLLELYLQSDPVTSLARWIGAACLGSAVLAQLWALTTSRTHYVFHSVFLLVVCATVVIAVIWYPLHYVWILSSLLLYHFVVWFLFYGQLFWQQRRAEFRPYLFIHALVLLPFLALLLPETAMGNWVDTYLLNSYTFLTLTVIHITTSFMSESWAARWLGLATTD